MDHQTDKMEFHCPVCKARQPWRPEAAGRPLICSCGTALVTPFMPGPADRPVAKGAVIGSAEQIVGDGNDAADGTGEILLCPECGAIVGAQDVACEKCGIRRRKPKRRIFRRTRLAKRGGELAIQGELPAIRSKLKLDPIVRPLREFWEHLSTRPARELGLPLTLAGAGLLVELGLVAHVFGAPPGWVNVMRVVPLIILLAASTMAVVFLVAIVLSPVLDLDMGPIGPLTVRLSAGVLFPAAIGALVYFAFGHGISGGVAGWLAAMVVYLALFHVIFEFDWPDTLLLIAFVSLAHTAVLVLLVWPLAQGLSPVQQMWTVFEPIAIQSILTLGIAGGMVAPHLGEAA